MDYIGWLNKMQWYFAKEWKYQKTFYEIQLPSILKGLLVVISLFHVHVQRLYILTVFLQQGDKKVHMHLNILKSSFIS
jgi:hypothetical protein